jgi:cold shock CspA family protein
MPVGTVKWFDVKKGFGFIGMPDSGRDVYVSYEDIENYGRTLQQGDLVEFETTEGKNGRRAINVIIKTKTATPSHAEIIQDANYYTSVALVYKNNGDHVKAREFFEKAITLGPKNYEAFIQYGLMERQLNLVENARRVYQRGIERFQNDHRPGIGKLYEQYGMLEIQSGNLLQAAEIFRHGVNRFPDNGRLHLHRAQVLFDLGDPNLLEEVERHFDIAKKLGAELTEGQSKLFKLFKVLLRGHSLGPLSLKFLTQAGFSPSRILHQNDQKHIVDFLVTPKHVEYVESYDLSGEIFVRCLNKSNPSAEDVSNLLQDLKSGEEHKQVGQDVLFLILRSSAHLKDYFYQLLERAGKNQTVVPIDEMQINAGLDSSNSERILRQILNVWLYHRNLYDEHYPVSGRKFFGREHELAGLVRSIDFGRSVGLFGLRKVGKTSLLKTLKEKRPYDIAIDIDLQIVPPGIKECGYLYWEMANQLRAELTHKYPDIEKKISFMLGGKYPAYVAIPNQTMLAAQFDADLRSAKSAFLESPETAAIKVLVLVDEVEIMLPMAGRKGFKGYIDFFAYLRGISQQQGFLISIVTGANPAICEQPQWEGRDNPVFKFYQEIFLPPFEKRECDEMIQKLGKGMGISYNQKSLQRIYEESGGHPFVARQLCSRIAKHFRERPLEVYIDKVEQGIEEFLFYDSSIFREILERLEKDFPEEKELLLFIADGVNTEVELSSLSKSDVQESLRHLVGYQLVERDGKTYRFKMGLLLKWIRRHWLNRED